MSKTNPTRLLLKLPDQQVPEAYLRKVLEGMNCGGYAVQTLTDNKPQLVTDRMDTVPELEAVQRLLEGYASHRVLLSFSKLEKIDNDLTGVGPFDFSAEGNPADVLMAFGIEGDFPSLVEAGITEEANLAKKVIIPNFNKFLKLSGGSLDAFLAELKDPTFVDSLMVRIGDRGQFMFLPPIGDHIPLGKNKIGSSFPWGEVSDTLGYTETPAKAVTEPLKKTGWWGDKKGPTLPVKAEEPSAQPAKKDPPPVPLDIPAATPDTKIDAPPADPNAPPKEDLTKVPPPAGHWEYLPKGLNNKDKKALIRRLTNCGSVLPEGWDKPDYKVWIVDYPKAQHPAQALADKHNKNHDKPTLAAAGTKLSSAPSRGGEVAEAQLMVLSAEEKSSAESTLLKIMDRQGKEIPSPLDIQKAMAKYPKFTATFGIDLDKMMTFLPGDIAMFAKSDGKAFFHSWIELRSELAEARAALASIGDKHVAPVTPEPKVEEPVKQAVNAGWGWGNK